MDTEGQELQNKWQEIENRIQTSRENIEQSNVRAAAANADKAIEDWKMAVSMKPFHPLNISCFTSHSLFSIIDVVSSLFLPASALGAYRDWETESKQVGKISSKVI